MRSTRARGVTGALAASVVAAGAGAAAVAVLGGRTELLVLINTGLVIAVAAVALTAAHLVRDVREQQRQILRHMEIQTRVIRDAARAAHAADHYDEPW
ncbi:hypothetical protein [Actinomadura litoris]|uniref:hypothetical protein n=1 Tax=Actinomadura litoris TaxID=2678616 RepID=UPI001FA6D300|nr:hypothetical protein [Actinomadura litoris]